MRPRGPSFETPRKSAAPQDEDFFLKPRHDVRQRRARAVFARLRRRVEGVGLNITVMTYCDTAYFGLNGCRTTMPGISIFRR